MLFDSFIKFTDWVTQLYDGDHIRQRDQHSTPEDDVEIVDEIDEYDSQFKNEISIVSKWRLLLPGAILI